MTQGLPVVILPESALQDTEWNHFNHQGLQVLEISESLGRYPQTNGWSVSGRQRRLVKFIINTRLTRQQSDEFVECLPVFRGSAYVFQSCVIEPLGSSCCHKSFPLSCTSPVNACSLEQLILRCFYFVPETKFNNLGERGLYNYSQLYFWGWGHCPQFTVS